MCAVILAVGVTVGILFLEETHAEKKHRRDVGLELGRWMLRQRKNETPSNNHAKLGDANIEESRSLLEDDEPPGYRTTEGTPYQQVSRAQSPVPNARFALDIKVLEGLELKADSVHKAFTKQVIMNIAGYGILA